LQSIAEYERIEKPSAGERRILANQRNQLLELRRAKNSSVPVDSASVNLRDFLESQSFSVIEFMMTDSACFAFIHQPGQPLGFRKVGGRADIDRLAGAWRTALTASAYRGKSLLPADEQAKLTADFDRFGNQLSNLLLDGLDLGGTKELVIITDGELHFLPFGALPVGDKYLVDHFPVRYAYSLRHLQELGTISRPDNNGSILAVAPSFGGSAAPLIASRSGGDLGLRPLANNISEVEAIGDMLSNSVVLTRAAATRDSFFALAEAAQVIHLSSHGVVDPRNPNRSFIAFTQAADTLQGEELLYFNDLTRLSLAAEMVTLSACETNLGEVVPGEHVLSMGGAFAAAGARSTVSTLWQVDDAATTMLMQRFYQELTVGADRSIALQRAQKYLREETDYGHPYYWAGFTLHGVNGTLELASAGSNYWLLGGLAALGLGLGLLIGIRRSRG